MRSYTVSGDETLADIARREPDSESFWLRLYAGNAGVCPRQVKGPATSHRDRAVVAGCDAGLTSDRPIRRSAVR
jgi:hypothetical protein